MDAARAAANEETAALRAELTAVVEQGAAAAAAAAQAVRVEADGELFSAQEMLRRELVAEREAAVEAERGEGAERVAAVEREVEGLRVKLSEVRLCVRLLFFVVMVCLVAAVVVVAVVGAAAIGCCCSSNVMRVKEGTFCCQNVFKETYDAEGYACGCGQRVGEFEDSKLFGALPSGSSLLCRQADEEDD